MGSRKAAALSVLVFVCAFAGPQPATAQPPLIAAIHSGTLTVSTSSTRPQMSVGAGAVDVVSVFDDGTFEPERCRPCASGQRVGVGGRLVATGTGNAVYDGDFTITGEPLVVPENAGAEVLLTGTFTFQGRVVPSRRRNAPPDEREPAIDLDGTGRVTVTLTSSVDAETGARLYFFQHVTYQFSRSAQ
jgi:hypothetical protein